MAKIKALVKDPGKKAEPAEVENTIEAIEALLGGKIERISASLDPKDEMVLIADKDRNHKDLQINFPLFRESWEVGKVTGRVLILGKNGDEYTAIPERMVRPITDLMPLINPEYWGDRKEA